ncbi:MAG TPA: hypothetical protein VHO28_07485, partial [Ignavibacteriales bacterium]|nr:hypothetical protein [Ignavibacteriales bacterium]
MNIKRDIPRGRFIVYAEKFKQAEIVLQLMLFAVLKTKGVDVAKKLLIIHGGSGGSAVDLPIPKMRELAALLNGLPGIYVLLTGNEKEKAVCKELEAGENVINLAGEFDLRE